MLWGSFLLLGLLSGPAAGTPGEVRALPAGAGAAVAGRSDTPRDLTGDAPILLPREIGPALAAALWRVGGDDSDRGSLPPEGVLRADYWGALGYLSRGSPERACEALVELEAPVFGSLAPAAEEVLAAAERDVALRLAEIDGDSLLPLVALHADLANEYRRSSHDRMADHAVRMATETARLFAAHAAGSGAPEIAAAALASLAGQETLQGPAGGPKRILDSALAIEPESEPALLMLAADVERHGDPASAAIVLRRLLASHPGCHEASLRLAVCLRRTGQPVPEALLRSCQAPAAPAWVRAVAIDELARQAADRDDWKAAIAVLTEAVQAMPDQAGFRIELAHACDRAGRPADALAAVRPILEMEPATAPSPRLVYARPVPEPVAQQGAVLAERSRTRLAALALALARTSAPPEAR